MKYLFFVLRLFGYVWALPLNLVGIFFLAFCRPILWVQWDKGFLEIGVTKLLAYKTTTGQTHGWMTLYKAESPEAVRPGLRVHEQWHGWQGTVGGIFYGISYVLFFLVLWAWYRDSNKGYHAIPWEVWARAKEQEKAQ